MNEVDGIDGFFVRLTVFKWSELWLWNGSGVALECKIHCSLADLQ
jgi:hypothetical protein